MSTSIEHDGTAVDVKLFETIGLYKLMRPASRGGDRYRKAGFAVLCSAAAALVVATMAHVVQIYWMVQQNVYDIRHIVYAPLMFTSGTMFMYKGLTVIKHGDRMRSTLDVAKYDYTSIGRRDATELRRCRGRVSAWLRVYVVFSVLSGLTWCVEPWTIAVAEDGGAHAVPVWAVYNIAETCVICVSTVCYSMFDCYLVTVCCVLNAQYRSVARAYSSIGWHRRQQSSSKPTDDSDTIQFNDYSQLILIIKDNSKINKIFDEVYDILRPAVIFHIFSISYSIVTLMILILYSLVMDNSIISQLAWKFILGYLLTVCQLSLHCFLFSYLETAKSTLNFGLYSSNWTSMSLKFKKTLLLAMHINSAHNKMMKVTPKNIVNMEMFAKVIKMSYSISSVFLNLSFKKKDLYSENSIITRI